MGCKHGKACFCAECLDEVASDREAGAQVPGSPTCDSSEFDKFFNCIEKNANRIEKDAMIGRLVREQLGALNSIAVISRLDVEKWL